MKIHGVPAFRFLVSRALWASRCSSLLTFKTPQGYRLRFYPSSLSAAMWCEPAYYRAEEEMLCKHLRPGDTFVDVGANIGTLALTAARVVGSAGQVLAIEAHPRTYRYLCGNIALNAATNVTAIHAAAGEKNGVIHLTDKRGDNCNQVSDSGVPVPLHTLDSIVPEVPVRMLKIDVEGFELPVLKGAERTLSRTEFVFFESWEQHFNKFSYSTADVLAFLTEHGFNTGRPAGYRSESLENILASRR